MKKIQLILQLIFVILCLYLCMELYAPDLLEDMKGDVAERITGIRPQPVSESASSEDDGEEMSETETRLSGEPETETEAETEPALPTAYNSRDNGRNTKIKNQGTLNTCWAVAATTAMESSLMPGESVVLSPEHLADNHGYNKGLSDGGAYTMAMAYLAAWKGPVLEEQDAYGDGIAVEGLTPYKHVQEMQMLREYAPEKIKRAVYNWGGVQSSIYMDMEDTSYSSVYFSNLNQAYCYNGEEAANHDIVIVGWDDNYPAENFTADVSDNGAFLCQNSWGEGFGNGGLFWISYEDAVIGREALYYTKIEESENYDYIYQTDLCGWVGSLGFAEETIWCANVYTAQSDEQLQAAGFYATGENTQYELYTVENFQNSYSLLLRNKVGEGTIKEVGYYTLDFDEPISVKEGQKFAVVMKIKTPGSEYPAATEYQADEYTATVDIADGRGYISANGLSWRNVEEEYDCNLCLKVFSREQQ